MIYIKFRIIKKNIFEWGTGGMLCKGFFEEI